MSIGNQRAEKRHVKWMLWVIPRLQGYYRGSPRAFSRPIYFDNTYYTNNIDNGVES